MKKYYLFITLFLFGLIWSGINPENYLAWVGEIIPTIIGLIVLGVTFKKFRYTTFTYSVILFACYLMFIGSHYTFAKVPLFDWIRDTFGQNRNNYDKLGHFVQGIVPVLLARELFIRSKIMKDYKWISFISFCVCLATTSTYEIVEFLACSLSGNNPDLFLGTQGYIWDSQSDMLFAALGGIIMLLFLRKFHDRIIEREFPGTFERFRNT
jgi:putative membrane protein